MAFVVEPCEWPPNGIQTLRIARLRRYGPGNIGVDATCLFGYKGGVISNCTGKSVDHATLVVGAGYDSSLAANPPNPAGPMPYWIVVSPHAAPWTLQALCCQVPRAAALPSICLPVCLSVCPCAYLPLLSVKRSVSRYPQKNSWGPKYGEGGFYRMERNRRQVDFKGAAFPIAAAAKTSQ